MKKKEVVEESIEKKTKLGFFEKRAVKKFLKDANKKLDKIKKDLDGLMKN